MSGEDDGIVLTILHTADWHLGKRFRSFPPEGARRLERARLEVLHEVLAIAERYQVDAVLCAGDLFDEPRPEPDWWEGLLDVLRARVPGLDGRPVFLLPGNHDPFTPDSVWNEPRFRAGLPPGVTVVDRPLTVELGASAVLYAVPCTSSAGQTDPTAQIPARAEGDTRVRIGMVHGSTLDVPGAANNFPIDRDAIIHRGLDYLAIGDTHGFRFVPPDRTHLPTVYPGAPEPTAFDEVDPGHVVVARFNRRRMARVEKLPVARWRWEEHTVTSLDELRALADRRDLLSVVLRLTVELTLEPAAHAEAERLLAGLQGTAARSGSVGVLDLRRQGLTLDTSAPSLPDQVPEVFRGAIEELRRRARLPGERVVAERALQHLLQLLGREG